MKRILSLLLTVLLCTVTMCFVSAEDTVPSGTCGTSVSWTFSGGVLNVTGTGDMANYNSTEAVTPWADYAAEITSIVIGDGVTSVGPRAFAGLTALKTVSLAESITSIGGNAFKNCAALEAISIPANVTKIGGNAFDGCKAITEVVLPASMKTVDVAAFLNCSNLASVTLNEGLTTLANSVFKNSKLTEITLPASLESVGDGVFAGTTLTKMTVLNAATVFGASVVPTTTSIHAAAGSTAQTYAAENGCIYVDPATGEVTYPTSGPCGAALKWTYADGILTVSGTGTMSDFNTEGSQPWMLYLADITKVVVEEGVESLGFAAFKKCTALTEVTLPESLKEIGPRSFEGCTALTEITLPTKLTGIGNYAFSDCKQLTEIELPATLTSIGNGAFNNCTRMLTITVPNTVTEAMLIKDGAAVFNNTPKLIILGTAGSEAQSYAESNNIPFVDTAAPVPYGSAGSYISWILRDGTLQFIGRAAMTNFAEGETPWYAYRESITAIAIDSRITLIGTYAFQNFTALKSVVLPDEVTSVNEYAFNGCTSLSSVTLSSKLETIKWHSFRGCTSLASVSFPESLKTLSHNSFKDCTALKEITLPSGLTSLGNNAFAGCTALAKIAVSGVSTELGTGVVPMSTVVYGKSNSTAYTYATSNGLVFVNMDTGETITPSLCGNSVTWKLENGTLTISGTGVMYDYEKETAPWYADRAGITSLVVGEGVTNLGKYAFYNCAAITSVSLPSTLVGIKANAFEACAGITSVTLPEGLERLDPGAFSGTSLSAITLPQGLKTLGGWVFANTKIESIVIPAGITVIKENTFDNCSSLKSVTFLGTVTEIWSNAFRGCASLEEIQIPVSVTSIGGNAFKDSAMKYIFFGGTEAAWTAAVSVSAAGAGLPAKCTVHYEAADHTWLAATVTAPALCSVCGAADGTPVHNGNYCGEAVTWTLENGVLTVSGTGAMYDYHDRSAPWNAQRDSITKIVVNSGVTTIGANAFNRSINATSVSIPEGITYIGKYAFYNMASLTSIQLPSTLETIMGSALRGCGFTSVILPDSVRFLGDQAFAQNTSLTSFAFPASIAENDGAGCISTSVLAGCSALTEITVPEGVTVLNANLFRDCTSLKTVNLPSTLTEIGNTVFRSCTALESITLPASVKKLGNGVFHKCTSLKEIILPVSLETLGDGAFAGCSVLAKAILPSGLTIVGSQSFQNCTALTELAIPASVTSIGANAFNGAGLRYVFFEGTGDAWIAATAAGVNLSASAYIHYESTGHGYTCQTEADTYLVPGYTNTYYKSCVCGKAGTATFTTASVSEDAQVIFTVDEVNARPGDTVNVDILVTSDVDVNSIALTNFVFDSTVLTFKGFANTDEIAAKCQFSGFDASKQTITIGLISSEALSGRICTLQFTVAENASEGDFAISMDCLVKRDGTVIPSGVYAGEIAVREYVLGDINGDSSVDIRDAALLFQYSMIPEKYPITYPGNVDFDKDGDVDIDDAAYLFQYSMVPNLYPIN